MKRRSTLLMSLVIATTMLVTGCSTKGDSKANGDSAGKTSTTTDGDGRKMEGNMYLEGLPLVKEKETFKFLVDDSGAPEDKYFIPILEEKTNVKVEWLLYPYEVAKEKKNILINSGDYPDVIGGWLLGQDDILTQGMGEGLYVPIDEQIKKYSPNMTNILDIKGVRETMTLPDGHIYTIPYVLGAPKVPFNPYINKKWLDAVGMKMPTTTGELIEVLKAFRDKDPNGNGKKDEIPFSGDPNNQYLGMFAGWFGMPCPKANFTMVNGELTFASNTESFKAAIKFFRQLNDEKLIDKEYFTQDLAQWKAKGNQDLYGVCYGYGAGDWAGEKLKPGERTDFVPLPVLKGPNVDKPLWQRSTYGSDVLKTQVAITDKAKNLPTIIRWFDYVLSEDVSVQLLNGPFDISIKKAGDKKYQRIDTSKMAENERKKYEWANLFPQSLPKFIPLEVEYIPAPGAPEEYKEKDLVDSMYEPFLNEKTPASWISKEDSKRASTIQTDIEKFVNDKIAKWVSGQADIDAEWDAYKAQLEKLGVSELTNIRRKALPKK